ncbi:hypothetical protein Anas_10404 [Armadillidium nasatum]|uniref:Peptidase M28 domain-containing protein n=1 Tax=Armadillidium nasatum TaxID=96803 RepID=A0A5N5TCD7_9CRUS|nr:hypothetical protein Anas_10404 [Armadillidium nasatum]
MGRGVGEKKGGGNERREKVEYEITKEELEEAIKEDEKRQKKKTEKDGIEVELIRDGGEELREKVTGVNLIGISEGDEDGNGSVIVVAADYDSNVVDNQLKNNAGGVACLLETMHLFYDKYYWNQYYLNYTVIFVALDLNTREYHTSGNDHPGSYYFIHEWLLDYLGNDTSVRNFRGAIILDSVTTYNTGNATQHLRGGFEKDETERPFRLQEMEIHLKFSLVGQEMLEMINHQSHYSFWTNIEERYLPAFLLFDTDEDREDPTPNACSEINCNVDEFLTDERINFMNQTTQALLSTLMKLQTSHYDRLPDDYEDSDSATILAHSSYSLILMTTSLTFILAHLLRS